MFTSLPTGPPFQSVSSQSSSLQSEDKFPGKILTNSEVAGSEASAEALIILEDESGRATPSQLTSINSPKSHTPIPGLMLVNQDKRKPNSGWL